MSAFDIFQTETGTLQKKGSSASGDETVISSQSVNVDPVFGWKNMYDSQGNIFRGASTILSDVADVDVSHLRYDLVYKGRTYQVEQMLPVYSIGGNVLEHLEVIVR